MALNSPIEAEVGTRVSNKAAEPQTSDWWKTIADVFNLFNHILIAIVSMKITWICITARYEMLNLHVVITTLGYQLLMAEAILIYYSSNSWSSVLSRKTKSTLHLVLQVLGSGLAIFGVFLAIWWRDWRITFWNGSLHAQLGFWSLIFLFINFFFGFGALYASSLRKVWEPIYMKFTHNLLGIAAFVLGMVSLYYGYEKRFMTRNASKEMINALAYATLITTVLSCIGALQNLLIQGKGSWSTFQRNRSKTALIDE